MADERHEVRLHPFRFLAIRQIDHRAQHPDGCTVPIAHDDSAIEHPGERAVAPPEAILTAPRLVA
jgi:hypothetical protein